jgi:hypothetical protein
MLTLPFISSKEAEMADLKRVTTPFSYSLAVAAGDYIFLAMHRGWGDDLTAQFNDTLRRRKRLWQSLT